MEALEREELVGRYAQKVCFTEAYQLLDHLGGPSFNDDWVFRGQERASWGLVPTVERYAAETDWHHAEARALRVFKSSAHLYLSERPAAGDQLSWLSLLRHHGGPTRLVQVPVCSRLFCRSRGES